MSYTVQKLAKLSGVSVRTLHFYDEINLLKPSFVKTNGYRYYEEKELLLLQQILFFKELGMELKKIQKILGKSQFDQVAALHSHRKVLHAKRAKTEELIETIDKTICHLTGGKKMENQEMYHGFITNKQQAIYEAYLKTRFGKENSSLKESKENVKGFTKADWEETMNVFNTICKDLYNQMEDGLATDSPIVQRIVLRHCTWLKTFWTPSRQSYIGLGQTYREHEWKKAFESHDPEHPRLAKYLANAMKIYAERELTE